MRNFNKNKHKRSLSPRKRELTRQNATTFGIFPLVGTGGSASCHSEVPRPMTFYENKLSYRISLDINKRCSAFDHGKDTGYKLIPEYILSFMQVVFWAARNIFGHPKLTEYSLRSRNSECKL